MHPWPDDLDLSFAKLLKLSQSGSRSEFADALADFNAKAKHAHALEILAKALDTLEVVEPPLDAVSALPPELLDIVLTFSSAASLASLALAARSFNKPCERAGHVRARHPHAIEGRPVRRVVCHRPRRGQGHFGDGERVI